MDPMQEWMQQMQQLYGQGQLATNAAGPVASPASSIAAGLSGPTDAQGAFASLTDHINSGSPKLPPDPNAPSGQEAMATLADHKFPPQPIPAARMDSMRDMTPMTEDSGSSQSSPATHFATHQHVIGGPDVWAGGVIPGETSDKKKRQDLSALLPLLKTALAGPDHQGHQIPYGGGVQPGHGGAINPSIPVLASLPLPGVNLRERLNGKVR